MVVSNHKCHLGNISGSVCMLKGEGLKINFPLAHEVHIKSVYLRNLTSLKL
jgi:hypothetical protein